MTQPAGGRRGGWRVPQAWRGAPGRPAAGRPHHSLFPRAARRAPRSDTYTTESEQIAPRHRVPLLGRCARRAQRAARCVARAGERRCHPFQRGGRRRRPRARDGAAPHAARNARPSLEGGHGAGACVTGLAGADAVRQASVGAHLGLHQRHRGRLCALKRGILAPVIPIVARGQLTLANAPFHTAHSAPRAARSRLFPSGCGCIFSFLLSFSHSLERLAAQQSPRSPDPRGGSDTPAHSRPAESGRGASRRSGWRPARARAARASFLACSTLGLARWRRGCRLRYPRT